MWTRRWLSREMAMYERSGAPRRWESRTESEREGVRVAPGLGLVRDRVERVALLAMQSSPAPLPGDEVAGGTSVYVASVAAALAAVGVSCDIYTRATSPDQPVLRDLGPGVRLVSVEAGPLAPLGRTQLVPLVQTFTGNLAEVGEDLGPYQLLSAHWWLSGLAGLRLRAWWRVPMEFRPHSLALARNRALVDLALARSPARSQCEARIIDRADLLVAGSESESADLMGHYGAPAGKVRVIPCGVDPELFRPGDPQRARDRLGVDLTARHLLAYVGRLDAIKGVELAIETLAALSDQWPSLDVELLLVGGSTDPVRYRQQVAALRHRVNWQAAAGRVHFIPAQPHRSLPSVYQAADLLLMPSRTETFGLVALEAQACGTPVVASRAGSLPEVVSDRITGALVTRRDPGAWARTIAALLGCPARLQAMRALAFGLLSLPDGPDLSLAAAAQLLGRDEGPTQMLLERLIDVQMLQSPAPGRYQMHDLLRLFAREQAQRQERPEARRAALRRVLHWYHDRAAREPAGAARESAARGRRRGWWCPVPGSRRCDGMVGGGTEEPAGRRQAGRQAAPAVGGRDRRAGRCAVLLRADARVLAGLGGTEPARDPGEPEARGPHRGEQGAQRPRRGLLPFRPPPRGDRAPGAGAPDPSRPRRPRGRVGRPRQPDHRLPRVRAVGGGHRELRARAHDLPSVRLPLRRGDPRQHLGPRLPGPGPPRRRHRSAAGVAGDLRGPWRCIWARQFPRESRGGLPSGRPALGAGRVLRARARPVPRSWRSFR